MKELRGPTSSPHQVIRSSHLRGPGAMLLSALLFAAMGALVKMAGRGGVPAAETTFVRFAVGLITCLLLAPAGVIRLQFRRRRLHVVRGVFGSLSALLSLSPSP